MIYKNITSSLRKQDKNISLRYLPVLPPAKPKKIVILNTSLYILNLRSCICKIISKQSSVKNHFILHKSFLIIGLILWRLNTQHNDTEHNDTEHNDTEHNDTEHNDTA
jgi:hypothetical protein